jgi:hypothetical protein
MKVSMAILLVPTLGFLSAIHAYAGGTETHGGDLQCDAKIQSVTSNIRSWIRDQGPEVGKLDLSSSRDPFSKGPYGLAGYDSAMLALLGKNLNIDCVAKGDPEYPVLVGGNAKVCKNTVNGNEIKIVCDRDLLLALSPDQVIEQIHHEFATDVPGLEPDSGPLSSYQISTQLSAYMQDVTERKLVVGPGSCDSGCKQPDPLSPYRNEFNQSASVDFGQMTQGLFVFVGNLGDLPMKDGSDLDGTLTDGTHFPIPWLLVDTRALFPSAAIGQAGHIPAQDDGPNFVNVLGSIEALDGLYVDPRDAANNGDSIDRAGDEKAYYPVTLMQSASSGDSKNDWIGYYEDTSPLSFEDYFENSWGAFKLRFTIRVSNRKGCSGDCSIFIIKVEECRPDQKAYSEVAYMAVNVYKDFYGPSHK